MPIIKGKNVYDLHKKILVNNDLEKYIDLESVNIQISSNLQYTDILNKIKISDRTYKEVRKNCDKLEYHMWGEEHKVIDNLNTLGELNLEVSNA